MLYERMGLRVVGWGEIRLGRDIWGKRWIGIGGAMNGLVSMQQGFGLAGIH